MKMYVEFPSSWTDTIASESGSMITDSGNEFSTESHIGSKITVVMNGSSVKYYPQFQTAVNKMYPVFN